MKIVSYLFISLFVLSFASCSKNDDNNQEVNILGKWNVSEMTMEGSFTEEGVVAQFNGSANEMTGNDVTFLENNTFTGNSAPFEMEITYVVNGIPFSDTQQASTDLPVSGEWSKEGNILYLEESGIGERTEYTIETLDATTLKLSADQDSVDMGDEFPAGAQFRVTVTLKR